MYTIFRMKRAMTVLLLVGAMSAWASQPTALSLPPVVHADAEVVTNMPMPALSQRSGKFAFSLGCRATPTNNVEIAFGTDVDEDGVLAPRETRLVVGWDSGCWFVRRGFSGERSEVWRPSSDLPRMLSWELSLGLRAVPRRLAVYEGTEALDFELSPTTPNWLYDANWNLMRLTGRGLHDSGETFTIGTPLDPTAILFR